MNIFIASLKNEIMKITARKKFWVFLIIEVLICLGTWGVNQMLGRMSGGMTDRLLMMEKLPFSMLSFFVQAYIPLLVAMTACDLYSGEVHDGTLRASFMRPVSRFKLYGAKAAALFSMATLYMLVLFGVTTIIKVVTGGGFAEFGEGILAYGLDLVPMAVLILFIAMLNQFHVSPSLAMILSIGFYLGLHILGILMPHIGGLLFTGYSQWHNLWLGATLPFRSIVAKTGLLLGYGLVFGCIGYYLFERKEA